jgi:hypothetical protein
LEASGRIEKGGILKSVFLERPWNKINGLSIIIPIS